MRHPLRERWHGPGTVMLASGALAACAGPGGAALGRAKVELHCDAPDAELTVDGVPYGAVGDYAGPHRLLLSAGEHRLVLRGNGSIATRSIMVGAQDNLTLTIALSASGQGAPQGDAP